MSQPASPASKFARLSKTLWHWKSVRLLIAIVVGLWTLDRFIHFATEMQWFESVGYGHVRRHLLFVQVCLGVAGSCAIFFPMLWPIRSLLPPRNRPLRAPDEYCWLLSIAEEYRRRTHAYAWTAAVFLSLAVGWALATHWSEWLLFTHGSELGRHDIYFGREFGFYVFQLPFLKALLHIGRQAVSASIVLIALLTIGRAVTDLLTEQATPPRLRMSSLYAAGAVWFFLLAVGYGIDQFNLLTEQHPGEFVAAGIDYLDWNVRRPALALGIIVATATSVLLLWSGFARTTILRKYAAIFGLASLILPPATIRVATSLGSWLFVGPNEERIQRPFYLAHVNATRAGWSLTNLDVEEMRVEPIRPPVPEAATAAISQAPIWDATHLRGALQTGANLPNGHTLHSLTFDRLELGGRRRLAAVVVHSPQTDNFERKWTNRHVATSPTRINVSVYDPTQRSDSGEPVLLSGRRAKSGYDDTPADATYPAWYGPGESNYVLVAGSAAGAVHLNSFWTRLLWSLRLRDINLLLHTMRRPGPTSLVIHRTPLERARRVAPFLQPVSEPIPVVVKGRLFWMVDLLSVSAHFPGAAAPARPHLHDDGSGSLQPYNAARDSVKMVMDSVDGHVSLYEAGEDTSNDTLASVWREALPQLIQPYESMPAAFRAHRRYPYALFRVQAGMLDRGWGDLADGKHARTLIASEAAGPVSDDFGVNYTMTEDSRSMRGRIKAENGMVLLRPVRTGAAGGIDTILQASCEGPSYGRLILLGVSKNVAGRSGPERLQGSVRGDSAGSQNGAEMGPVLPVVVRRQNRPAHLLFLRPAYVSTGVNARYERSDQRGNAGFRLKHVTLGDAAAPEMTGTGVDAVAALRQLGRKLASAAADNEAAATLPEQALRAHDAAQSAARRGAWEEAGQWWKRERQLLEKMAGASQPAE